MKDKNNEKKGNVAAKCKSCAKSCKQLGIANVLFCPDFVPVKVNAENA